MFQEYDMVRLRTSVGNLPKGLTGTILMIHRVPTLPIAYEVEFVDDSGKSLAALTVKDKDIEKLE